MPVIPDTGVLIGEDLIEGHCWTMDAMLLNTDRVGLLGCVQTIVFDPHLPTEERKCTCDRKEPEIVRKIRGMTLRSMQEHRPGKRGQGVSHGIPEISCGS